MAKCSHCGREFSRWFSELGTSVCDECRNDIRQQKNERRFQKVRVDLVRIYRVVLARGNQSLRFPGTCPCCGEQAETRRQVGWCVTSRIFTGTVTNTAYYMVPYCRNCDEYRSLHERLRSYVPRLVTVVIILLTICLVALNLPGRPEWIVWAAPPTFVLPTALLTWLILRTLVAIRRSRMACCRSAPTSATYVWGDGPQRWYFRSESYAADFAHLNGLSVETAWWHPRKKQLYIDPRESPTDGY